MEVSSDVKPQPASADKEKQMTGGMIPNLIIAQRVVDKMAKAAARFVHDETGEALVGLFAPGENTNGVPTLYVLDTIPPDEDDVTRAAYTFAHGGESQYEAFTWLMENWDADKEARHEAGFKWDAPLAHIGDWHKQPGYMIAPSGGDLASAVELLEENPDIERWLAPIVTLRHPPTLREGASVNYLTTPDGQGGVTRIDFWMIDRRARAFTPISATIYPDARLPKLAPLPWHLMNESRLSLEVGQLEHEGWLVSPIVIWDTDLKPPLEVCFMLGRTGGGTLLIVATEHDFPNTPPRAYAAPFVPMGKGEELHDVFEKAWSDADPLPHPDGFEWTPETYLVDYVAALLGKLPAAGDKGAAEPSKDEPS